MSTPPRISKATLANIPEMVRIINAADLAEASCIRGLCANEADIRSQMETDQFFLGHSPRNPPQAQIANNPTANATAYSVQGAVFCSQTREWAYL